MRRVPGVSRSISGVPAFFDPRAGRAELVPQMNGARSKPRHTGILHICVKRQKTIKTHRKFVRGDGLFFKRREMVTHLPARIHILVSTRRVRIISQAPME